MLTMADKGGRGDLDPPFLADIIWNSPLNQWFQANLSGKLKKKENTTVKENCV